MDNRDIAGEWYRFAEMDLTTAEYLAANMNPAPLEIICYHCQQAAEKHLKGYLTQNDFPPPRTHDLNVLYAHCIKYTNTVTEVADACSELTGYDAGARYPYVREIAEADVKKAICQAKIVRQFVLSQGE